MATSGSRAAKPTSQTGPNQGEAGDEYAPWRSELEELRQANADLQAANVALYEKIDGVQEAVSLSTGLSVISQSVELLAAELAPLRQLVPATTTTDADPGVLEAIQAIRTASHAPTWEHISTLGVPTWSIPWIGAPTTTGRDSSPQNDAKSTYFVALIEGA